MHADPPAAHSHAHTHTHTNTHTHELTAEEQDLTQTTTLHRREFAPALTTRFRALKGDIRETVGYANDALRLRRQGDRGGIDDLFASASLTAAPATRFEFTTDAEAEDEFIRWLDDQIDSGIIESISRDRVRDGQHYTATYLRTAYSKGLRDAGTRLRDAGYEVSDADIGRLFSLPIHQETTARIYSRAYSELNGITDDMQREIRRELAQGLTDGLNPRVMANRLTERVDAIGITRARTLSRTEVSNAYNWASTRRYERNGVQMVDILTQNPCPICRAIAADAPYPIDEAHGLIPGSTHPNCVCTVAPVA